MTVKCATRVGTTNIADSSGAITDDLAYWYGYTITSGAGARSSISRWNYPAATGITTIVSGLPVHGGATMGKVVGQGGNLFWLEYTGITYLMTVPMAGGTPTTIWDSATAGFAGIVQHLSADPINGGVLLADQVFNFATTPTTITEKLIAVDAAGSNSVRFTRTDVSYFSGGVQLFNGTHDSRNIGLVVASDGAVWGFTQQGGGFDNAAWRWDGSFSFSAALGFVPHHMAPANDGQVRIQMTPGFSTVYGMGPAMTLDAIACGFDFETGAPDIGFGDGGTIAYGVSDGYHNIVYWSDAGFTSNGPWQLDIAHGGWSIDEIRF